jgi:hypothetical protein
MARALEGLFVDLIERHHAHARRGFRSSRNPAVMGQP